MNNPRKARKSTRLKVESLLKGTKIYLSAFYISNSLMVDFKSVTSLLEELITKNHIDAVYTSSGVFYKWKKRR